MSAAALLDGWALRWLAAAACLLVSAVALGLRDHGAGSAPHARTWVVLRPLRKWPVLRTVLVSHRGSIHATIDAIAWGIGLATAALLRFEFRLSRLDLVDLLAIVPLAALAQLVGGLASGLYTGRWRFGSFEEVAALSRTAVFGGAVLFAIEAWIVGERFVPLSATIIGAVIAFVLMGGIRYAWRLALEHRSRPCGNDIKRVLVFGAGEAGAQLVTSMLRTPECPYLPVAFLDDDPLKRALRIRGLPVIGTRHDLAVATALTGAAAVVIAIPGAESPVVAQVTRLATELGIDVRVLPSVRELLDGAVTAADVREVEAADLLGRRQIETNVAEIAGYLTGRRVLVTGAGGSIGSELCRQIYRFAPAELIMLDRDESALHSVQLSIEGRALLDSPDLVLANLQDRDAMERVFRERRPEVVFHAAALKHLPLLEMHPSEAVKANVWGTNTVLELAARYDVGRVVNISTDKAADPESVLGFSKRITERLTAWYAEQTGRPFLSVRFGNVLGSRGSVLGAFRAQVEAGGPITVTHPDVTRYFMTIEEAVELVIQAGGIGRPGEALVLDMGEPVRIDDVARLLARHADRPIEVVYTGLRPGEKLHEALLGAAEVDARPAHPLVTHVPVPPLEPAAVVDIDARASAPVLMASLRALCAGDVVPR